MIIAWHGNIRRPFSESLEFNLQSSLLPSSCSIFFVCLIGPLAGCAQSGQVTIQFSETVIDVLAGYNPHPQEQNCWGRDYNSIIGSLDVREAIPSSTSFFFFF